MRVTPRVSDNGNAGGTPIYFTRVKEPAAPFIRKRINEPIWP